MNTRKSPMPSDLTKTSSMHSTTAKRSITTAGLSSTSNVTAKRVKTTSSEISVFHRPSIVNQFVNKQWTQSSGVMMLHNIKQHITNVMGSQPDNLLFKVGLGKSTKAFYKRFSVTEAQVCTLYYYYTVVTMIQLATSILSLQQL